MECYEAKRAVIIGGTSGIGLATAKMLLDGPTTVSDPKRALLLLLADNRALCEVRCCMFVK
jgi:NAD(P)-dependent dehydrogenase (short-subunit alcohol dehydrogenase family)